MSRDEAGKGRALPFCLYFLDSDSCHCPSRLVMYLLYQTYNVTATAYNAFPELTYLIPKAIRILCYGLNLSPKSQISWGLTLIYKVLPKCYLGGGPLGCEID
jgi:hypothetical protein